MAQLSEVVAMFKKAQGANKQPGKPGVRVSAHTPAMPGMARGALGSMGSRTFKGRDSSAGMSKELETMNSPIFRAFMLKQSGIMPMTQHLTGR